MSSSLKSVEWVGSSLEDLKEFPEEVQQVVGYALYLAQCGEKHLSAFSTVRLFRFLNALGRDVEIPEKY
jgi:phage-related protein